MREYVSAAFDMLRLFCVKSSSQSNFGFLVCALGCLQEPKARLSDAARDLAGGANEQGRENGYRKS
jgi:hypothetical protein